MKNTKDIVGTNDNSAKFIKQLLNRMAIASMVALAGGFLSQIAGAIIAGQLLSGSGLAAISMATPIYYVYGAAGAMLGIGCSVVCATLIGKSKIKECHRVFTVTYILLFLIAVLFTVLIWIFIDPITSVLGATSENFEQIKQYSLAMATGGVGVMLIYPAFNLLRISGRNKTAAVIFILSGVISVALDFLFLIVFETGVAGVAVATCIGSGVAGLLGAFVIIKNSDTFKLVKPNDFLKTSKNIVVSGSPGAMEYFCFFICMLVLNNLLLSSLGESAVASYKIVDSINSFALIFIWGITGPITPLSGVFSAEHDTKSLKDTLKHSLSFGLKIVIPISVILIVFAPQAAGIFGMRSASTAVGIFALSLPLSLANHILIYLYAGTRRVMFANILMVSRMAFWVIISALPLIKLGGAYVWWCFLAAEILTLATSACLSFLACRKKGTLVPIILIDVTYEQNGKYVSFSTEPGQEAKAAEDIGTFCEENDLSPKTTMSISLAIEEMLTVTFANCKPDNINVRVLVVEGNDIVILRLRCGGALFNPIEYALHATDEQKMDILGVTMILKLAVSVDYRNTFGVNNTTIILD